VAAVGSTKINNTKLTKPTPKRAYHAKKSQSRRYWNGFDNGHPINAVHEIDGVDEPHSADKHNRAVKPPRDCRNNPHYRWNRINDDGHSERLQYEARNRFQRTCDAPSPRIESGDSLLFSMPPYRQFFGRKIKKLPA